MNDPGVYLGLLGVALVAATFFPMQSEALLAGLLLTGGYSTPALIAVASVGNTMGSVLNWWLGRSLEHFRDRRWFPIKPAALDRASAWYRRYGKWSLLLSWVPIIGDPLTMVAGVLREPIGPFLLLVGSAKTARYLLLAVTVLPWAA